MELSQFTSDRFGLAKREPGNKWAFLYFSPKALPRNIELESDTINALSKADASLGRLQGVGALIKDPGLLVHQYLRQEAVASSQIEGTQASLSDIYQAEVSEHQVANNDVNEVERYLAASQLGYELIKSLPITQRLLLQVHEVLLQGVRGEQKSPGEFRRTPVWIGSSTDNPETALFVPPLPGEVPELISDWEKFVNTPSGVPALIRCALMHYQFETIHPFLDGNGRIGRLLINLMLMREGRLETPLLYISGYLQTRREEYYQHLQDVREHGRIQEWLQFFLTAVQRSADDAAARSEALVGLREKYVEAASADSSKVGLLVDLLFANPYVTVSRVEQSTGLTDQTARKLLRRAEALGWISEFAQIGRGGKTFWFADEVFETMIRDL